MSQIELNISKGATAPCFKGAEERPSGPTPVMILVVRRRSSTSALEQFVTLIWSSRPNMTVLWVEEWMKVWLMLPTSEENFACIFYFPPKSQMPCHRNRLFYHPGIGWRMYCRCIGFHLLSGRKFTARFKGLCFWRSARRVFLGIPISG